MGGLGTKTALERRAFLPLHCGAEKFCRKAELKEAYAKARGTGLGLRLSDIQFELGTEEILVHFGSSIGDDASAWAFWSRQLSSGHTISVAAKNDSDCQLEIVRRLWPESSVRAC